MAVIAENLYAPELVPFVQSQDEELTEPVSLGLHRKHGLARLAAGLLFALSPVSYRAFLPQAKAQFYAEAPMSMQPERLVGPGDELNIMTYNIKSGELGIDGIAHVVKSQNLDLLFTNEDREVRSSQTGADLEQLIGMKKLFGESLVDEEGAFGNGIYTRLPVVGFHTYSLGNYRHAEHRTLSVAVLQIANGRHIAVATSHEENRQTKVRQIQMQRIVSILKDRYSNMPILFGGDLNDGPDSKTAKELGTLLQPVRLGSALDDDTSPNHLRGQIDHIFIPNDWHYLGSKIVGQEGESDHRGIVAHVLIPSFVVLDRGILGADTDKELCHV